MSARFIFDVLLVPIVGVGWGPPPADSDTSAEPAPDKPSARLSELVTVATEWSTLVDSMQREAAQAITPRLIKMLRDAGVTDHEHAIHVGPWIYFASPWDGLYPDIVYQSDGYQVERVEWEPG